MKRVISLLLAIFTITALLAVPANGANSPSYTMGSLINLSNTGSSPGNNAGHGNHQTRTVHTSHGDYAAYITSTYTDSENETVDVWSLFRIDPSTKKSSVIFTGEKYYDSSQVSLIVDKNENVWAITSTSDSMRNLTYEGLDCRAHRLDAVTGEVTSYEALVDSGGTKDGYGYAVPFYDAANDRIVVMHAGGDYEKGTTTGASLTWTIFSLKTNTWQTRARSVRLAARHCYMFGYFDENGGLMLLAQRDIKAVSLGYPEIGNDNGLTSADRQYMSQNGINRWAANYCWDELDLYYFADLTKSSYVSYNVVEADYSRVSGTQEERYTLEKRLSNFYPANQNNNGGDLLLTESSDGRKLLHITYNSAYIQAAMDRSVGTESIWYHQVWDVTDPQNASRIYSAPITINGSVADDVTMGGGFSFRLYRDSLSNMYLISCYNGALSIYRIVEFGATYKYEKLGDTKALSKAGNLINISSHRGGSVSDDKLNVLYMNTSGDYIFTQVTVDSAEYEPEVCSHSYTLSDELSTAATCTKSGENVYVCDYCLTKYTEIVTAKGHSITTATVSATCTIDGYTESKCTLCGYCERVTEAAPGHSYIVTTTTSTCTVRGYTNTTCENCNYSSKESLPTLDHTYENNICTVCGLEDPSVSGYYKGDVDKNGAINSRDAHVLMRMVSGNGDHNELYFADLNEDGMVNAVDLNYMKRLLVGHSV